MVSTFFSFYYFFTLSHVPIVKRFGLLGEVMKLYPVVLFVFVFFAVFNLVRIDDFAPRKRLTRSVFHLQLSKPLMLFRTGLEPVTFGS